MERKNNVILVGEKCAIFNQFHCKFAEIVGKSIVGGWIYRVDWFKRVNLHKLPGFTYIQRGSSRILHNHTFVIFCRFLTPILCPFPLVCFSQVFLRLFQLFTCFIYTFLDVLFENFKKYLKTVIFAQEILEITDVKKIRGMKEIQNDRKWQNWSKTGKFWIHRDLHIN